MLVEVSVSRRTVTLFIYLLFFQSELLSQPLSMLNKVIMETTIEMRK